MKSIPLTQGKFALVDDQDYEILIKHKWCVLTGKNKHLYAARRVRCDGKTTIFLMHRVVTSAPRGAVVDHINGDGLDNRRSNLRVCSTANNIQNSRLRSDNTSGYKGVVCRKPNQRYEAYLTLNGRRVRLGLFRTAEEAAREYDLAARKNYGPFARLNFPDQS